MTILKMSLISSFLIVFVLIVRAVFLKRLPKRALLLLWAVVLCRLLIPFSIPVPLSMVNSIQRVLINRSPSPALTTTLVTNTVPMTVSINRPLESYSADAQVPMEPSFPMHPLMLVWLTGAAGLAGYFALTHIRTCRRYRATLPENGEYAAQFLLDHPIYRRVSIRRSDRILSPLTYGFLRPVILLPKEDPPDDALSYILMHEYLHIRRFDTLKKYVLAAALCVHWFNPLVWAMFFAANRDIEHACDEGVIRESGGDVRSAYALTLISMEEHKLRGVAALCSHFSQSAVETRIKAIMKTKNTAARRVLATLLVFVCLGGCFAASAVQTGGLGVNAVGMFDTIGCSSGTGTVIYLKSISYSDNKINAVLGVVSDVSETPSLTGRVWLPDGNKTLFTITGTVRPLPSGGDGVRYYAVSATAIPADPVNYPMLSSCSNRHLTLTVCLGGSRFDLGTEVGKTDTQNFVVASKQTLPDGITVDSLMLTPTELTVRGQSAALAKYLQSRQKADNGLQKYSNEDWTHFPNIRISLLLSNGRRIERWYPKSEWCDASSSFDEKGNFYISWRFSDLQSWRYNWELDMSKLTGIVINGQTYTISR